MHSALGLPPPNTPRSYAKAVASMEVPDEIVLEIFKFLKEKEIHGCSLVSRRWNRLAKGFFSSLFIDPLAKEKIINVCMDDKLIYLIHQTGIATIYHSQKKEIMGELSLIGEHVKNCKSCAYLVGPGTFLQKQVSENSFSMEIYALKQPRFPGIQRIYRHDFKKKEIACFSYKDFEMDFENPSFHLLDKTRVLALERNKDNSSIAILDLSRKKKTVRIETRALYPNLSCFSYYKKKLFAIDSNSNFFLIWYLNDDEISEARVKRTEPITALLIAKKMIIVGDSLGKISFSPSKNPVHIQNTIWGDKSPIHALAIFNNDLLSLDEEGSLIVWDLSTTEQKSKHKVIRFENEKKRMINRGLLISFNADGQICRLRDLNEILSNKH